MEIKIRNATLSDISSILEIAEPPGRYLSVDELDAWMKVDSKVIFVAEALPEGKIVGVCCGIRYTPVLGFIGVYNVRQEYRGNGIGTKLFNAVKEHLGDKNIGINAQTSSFKKYEKEFCYKGDSEILFYEIFGDSIPTYITSSSCMKVVTGFEGNLVGYGNKWGLTDKHESHEGSMKMNSNSDKLKTNIYQQLPWDRMTKSNNGLTTTHKKLSVISINANDLKNPKAEEILAQVVAYDKVLHKRNRSLEVKQFFCLSSCRSKVALEGGKVVGYACCRKVISEHWIIAPFYADTEVVAELLLFELLRGFDFSQALKGLQIIFPDKNIDCRRLVEKFGFRYSGLRLSTGFTKWCVNPDVSKIYSIHSPHFGCQ